VVLMGGAVGVGLNWDADGPSATARADYVRAIREPLRDRSGLKA
jgi:hypothetical protein